jgi:hypothetical protein
MSRSSVLCGVMDLSRMEGFGGEFPGFELHNCRDCRAVGAVPGRPESSLAVWAVKSCDGY